MREPYIRQTNSDQLVFGYEGENSLLDNFRRFDTENPHVYRTLVRLARKWVRQRPGEHCGIGMLFEAARWDLAIRTSGEPLRLNNNYRAFYARKIMANEKDLANLFHTRQQRFGIVLPYAPKPRRLLPGR